MRQATRENMRETLKEIDKKGIHHIIAHLNTEDTYWLLNAVSTGWGLIFKSEVHIGQHQGFDIAFVGE